MKDLIEILKSKHLSIGSVESLTGGLFASEITASAGVSAVYLGSIVSYANIIKHDLLGVNEGIIKKHGVISSETARLMAKNGSSLLKSDVTIAFTGNAGPDAMENKEVGLVFMCIKIKDKYFNYSDQLSGDRNDIRQKIVSLAKSRLIKLLEKEG